MVFVSGDGGHFVSVFLFRSVNSGLFLPIVDPYGGWLQQESKVVVRVLSSLCWNIRRAAMLIYKRTYDHV